MSNSGKKRYYLNRSVAKKIREKGGVTCNLKQEEDNILLKFKTRYSLKNSSLEIKHRSSGEILEYAIVDKRATVPLKDLYDFKNNVFDIYVRFDGKDKRRVLFSSKNESFSGVLKNEKKAIVCYSTIKNNLSLKFKKIFSYSTNIESFEMEDGKLIINGLLNLDMHVENPNVNLGFYLKIINRINKKEYCKRIEPQRFEMDMDDLLETVGFGTYDLYFISDYNGEIKEKRLKFPFKSDENISLYDKRYPILLYPTVYKNLSFKFDYDYSITDIKVDSGNLIMNGEFLNDADIYDKDKHSLPDFFVEIKNRQTGQRIEREIRKDGMSVPLSELLEIADKGLFDFNFKFKSDLDTNKKRIKFSPKLERLKFTLNEYERVLTVYSTVYGRLSLRLEEKDLDMNISKLEEIDNKVFIKGSFTPLNENIKKIDKATIVGKNRFGPQINEFNLDLNGNEFEGFIDEFDFEDVDLLNSRIDFFLRLYDGEVFYQELVNLSNLNSFYNDEERFLINISDEDNLYAYYATAGQHSLSLWVTTEQSFEKSYVISSGRTIYRNASKEKLNENMVFFESFFGKSYAGNPKYIYEEMLKMGLDKKYTFVWAYNGEDGDIIPGNPIIVKRYEAGDYYKYLAQSKYWVNNIIFPIHYKRKGNVYLQTWHGTPLKKLGFDITIPGPEVEGRDNFYSESRNWDYLISSNEYSTEIFKRAFKFEEEVLEMGYPINDIFFRKNEKVISEIKDRLEIPQDKKIILYAPTWKDDEQNDAWDHYFNLEIDLERLYEKFGDTHTILLKMHHLVSENFTIDEKMKGFAMDLSKYDDIQELYIISDILITDYSSVFFDYAHSRRPILFFVPDLEHYVSEVRGLYLNMETDMPGPLIKDNDYLIECIENIDAVEEEYKERYDSFYEKFCSICEGHSSQDIIKRVFELEEND